MSKTPGAGDGSLRAMASIRTETLIDLAPDAVWDALRDWGAPHERLVPGFVTDCRLDGPDRIVTFFNGATVKELFVDCDDAQRRLVWSVVDGPYAHHNGAAQLFAEPDGTTRFIWTADVLPHELAPHTRELMEQGTAIIQRTLSRCGEPVAAGQASPNSASVA
jgi:hypothetical protein